MLAQRRHQATCPILEHFLDENKVYCDNNNDIPTNIRIQLFQDIHTDNDFHKD